MTSLIIALSLIVCLAAFVWLGIRAFNRDKWEKAKTERRKAWFDFRLQRWRKRRK
jgi:hypothetical protein